MFLLEGYVVEFRRAGQRLAGENRVSSGQILRPLPDACGESICMVFAMISVEYFLFPVPVVPLARLDTPST
jgi:hypothetical protein